MVFVVGKTYSNLSMDEARSRLIHYPPEPQADVLDRSAQPSVLYRFGPAEKKSVSVAFGADSVNGQFVLSRLTDYLAAVDKGTRSGESLTGSIVIAAAVDQLILSDRVELKRIKENTQYWISIGSTQAGMEFAPHVVLNKPTADERATACLLGLPSVLEQPLGADSVKGKGWDEAWFGECLHVEVGRANHLDLNHCNALFQGLIGFLSHQGLLEGVDSSSDADDLHYFAPDQQYSELAQSNGFFVSDLVVGSWHQAGEHLGCIYDVSSGVLLEDIKLAESGYVSAVRRSPEVVEGDSLAVICQLAS